MVFRVWGMQRSSIDTNMFLGGNAANDDIFRGGDVFFLKLGEQRSHCRSTGNDFVFALGDEFASKFLLQLNMSFGIHTCYLRAQWYHAGEGKSSGFSGFREGSVKKD